MHDKFYTIGMFIIQWFSQEEIIGNFLRSLSQFLHIVYEGFILSYYTVCTIWLSETTSQGNIWVTVLPPTGIFMQFLNEAVCAIQ